MAGLPMSMSLKWCRKNLEHHSQAVYDLLREEYPDVPMEVVDCVDHCGLCTDVPFALRNDAIVAARDARGLYVKLKKGMECLSAPPLPGTYAAVAAQAEGHNSAQEHGEASPGRT
ncbi:MAG: YuzB family protein [Alicyclobacillus sp.]|nr:YuzB family protein [Alicyclobacillus sp.]